MAGGTGTWLKGYLLLLPWLIWPAITLSQEGAKEGVADIRPEAEFLEFLAEWEDIGDELPEAAEGDGLWPAVAPAGVPGINGSGEQRDEED